MSSAVFSEECGIPSDQQQHCQAVALRVYRQAGFVKLALSSNGCASEASQGPMSPRLQDHFKRCT